MFGNNEYIGEADKIDYIYKRLKSQARFAFIFSFIKIFIFISILYTGYSFYTGKNSEFTDKITLKFRESIVSIINPILNEVIGSMALPNLNSSNSDTTLSTNTTKNNNINISKEDIQKALDIINKK